MFDDVLLEPEHEELLVKLVEAQKSVPAEKREPFIHIRTNQGDFAIGGGGRCENICCPVSFYKALLNEGLLDIVAIGGRGSENFDVTPRGYRYYGHLKTRSGQPVHQVETEIRSFLDGPDFQAKYPLAYQKWVEAEQLLWPSDSERQYTKIGHIAREAAQEFAAELVNRFQAPNVDPNKAATKNRLKAVVAHRSGQLGTTEKAFLDALIEYWQALLDLVQRQEHGGQKEGEPLSWEDGRRVAFQLAVVMYEIDRSLS